MNKTQSKNVETKKLPIHKRKKVSLKKNIDKKKATIP